MYSLIARNLTLAVYLLIVLTLVIAADIYDKRHKDN